MTTAARFPGKVCLQQRVLPDYRAPFFDALAERCDGGLSVLAGLPGPEEAIQDAGVLDAARLARADNRRLFGGRASFWTQSGVLEWLVQEQPEVLVLEANPRYLSNLTARRWMHAGRKPAMGLKTLGRTATLADLLVYCKTCKASKTLAGATYPEKIREIHAVLKDKFAIYSPGVGAQGGDAEAAVKAGADYLIVGRSIVEAKDPAKTAGQIRDSAWQSLKRRGEKVE